MVIKRRGRRYSQRAMDQKELLGKRIKDLRNRAGLTQDALAERVQINSKYLSAIERGQENPTLDVVLRLADALNVEPQEVFSVEYESLDKKAIHKKIDRLIAQVQDENQLRLILRLLQAVLH